MSNAAIYTSWGAPIVGRETKSLEVFGQALEFWAQKKKEGKITSVGTYVATTGNGTRFGGCIIVEGEVEKLRHIVDTTDYKQLMLRARSVVDDVDVVHCVTGDEVQKFIGDVLAARKQLGITT